MEGLDSKMIEKIDWIRHHATDEEIAEILGQNQSHKFSDQGFRCILLACGGMAIATWAGLGLVGAIVGGLLGIVIGIWTIFGDKK